MPPGVTSPTYDQQQLPYPRMDDQFPKEWKSEHANSGLPKCNSRRSEKRMYFINSAEKLFPSVWVDRRENRKNPEKGWIDGRSGSYATPRKNSSLCRGLSKCLAFYLSLPGHNHQFYLLGQWTTNKKPNRPSAQVMLPKANFSHELIGSIQSRYRIHTTFYDQVKPRWPIAVWRKPWKQRDLNSNLGWPIWTPCLVWLSS